MAASVNQHPIQVHQQTHTDSSSPTFSERATSLVEGFNRSDISPEDVQTQAQLLVEELLTQLKEASPNLEEARGVFAKLLTLQAGDIPTIAVNALTPLFSPETMAYDLANTQANALISLECTLSEAIEHYLRIEIRDEFLLKLLNLYEDTLEHLWLLPYLSNDPEVHTIIVQQGVPPLLQRAEKMMSLLENMLHVSPQIQSSYRSIAMAYKRLATPLALIFVQEIKRIAPQSITPLFLGMLAQLYKHMQDYYRATYYYEKALDLADSFERRGSNLKELKGKLFGNLGNTYSALSNYPLAIEYQEKRLAIAIALEDRANEGKAYGSLGNIHLLLSHYAIAIKYLEKALSIALILEDRTEEGRACINLGTAHYSLLNYPLAIEFFEKALTASKALGSRSKEAATYDLLGNAYYSFGKHLLAAKCYEKALAIARDLGDRAKEGKAYSDLGNAHQSLCNYPLAIEYHKKALAVAQSLGDRADEGIAYGNLGNAHGSLGDHLLAIKYNMKKLEIAVDLGDRNEQSIACLNLGIFYQSFGNYPQAIEYQKRGLNITKALGNRAGEAKANCNLGIAHQSLDNYPVAIEFYMEALAISMALGDRAKEARVYMYLGDVYHILCTYPLAMEFYEKALRTAKLSGDQTVEGPTSLGLGNVHCSLGDYSLAIEYFTKALALAKALRNRANEGRAYGNLGNAHYSLGIYVKAIEYHKKANTVFKALGNLTEETTGYVNLGAVHISLGNYPLAITYFEKALLTAKALNNRSTEGRTYMNHVVVRSSPSSNHLYSFEYHEKALVLVTPLGNQVAEGTASTRLRTAQELGLSESVGGAHYNLGSTYVKLENYAKAEEHFLEGIRIYSHIQLSLKEMYRSKITIFEEQARVYFGLEGAYLIQNKHRDALKVSDSRRSRTLINRMQAKHSLSVDSLDAPMQIEEMQDLAEKLGTTFVVFRLSPLEEADLAFGIWIIHPEQEIVYRSIEAPIIHSAIRNGGITPFQDIGTSEETRGGDGLDSLFANLPSQELVTEVEKGEIAFLQDWYNELIAPIVDILPAEKDARITLVPDGPLMDLPFALLMDPEKAYLFEKYTISITPSIKTLHLLTQRDLSPSEKNLIVGNPTTPTKTPLPFSTKEARKVAEVTETPVEDIFVEAEALKTIVLANLEGSRFIHLACHGYPKAKDKYSIYDGAFYLTPDEDDSDGILYAEEIVDRDLNAELVLLSACHSGKGRQQKEGVIGSVRSFLAAGAQAVVATLWTLPDSELTIEMVSQFYEHVLGTSEIAQAEGRPLDKDEALREVMRMAALGPKRNRPQEWGAFFMTGALQPSSKKGSTEFDMGKEEDD